MSAVTQSVRTAAPKPRGGLEQSLHDSWVVTKRNLRRMTRIPEIVIFGLIQPIMFVVLFSFVFGGSMTVGNTTSPAVYREFLMAGIFAQTVTFATAGAGAGIADDMHKGVIDRFRSLPMTRGAVLTGRTLADLVQTALTVVVLAIVAVIVGWRIHNGVPKALGAFALLLLLGYAFSWIGALIGLSVRTPEAATSGGLIWLFPVTFISIAFVDSSRMVGWLQPIAEWNPFSATVQACRVLFGTGLMSEYLTTDLAQPAITVYCFSILMHNLSWVLFGRAAMYPASLFKDRESHDLYFKKIYRSSQVAFLFYSSLCLLSFWLPFVSMVIMTVSWLYWVFTTLLINPRQK